MNNNVIQTPRLTDAEKGMIIAYHLSGNTFRETDMAVVKIHGVGGEVTDTVQQCITPRKNGIQGLNTSTPAPILDNKFHLKFYK